MDDLENLLKEFGGASPKKPTAGKADRIVFHAQSAGVDPDLVRAMVGQESGGDPNAKSWAGNVGLLQVSQDVVNRFVQPEEFGTLDPKNPDVNLAGGTRYLKWLQDRYKGDWKRALAGYNAGEGNADKPDWLEKSLYWSNLREVQQGLKPRGYKGSTREYIDKISSRYGGGAQSAAAPDLSNLLNEFAPATENSNLEGLGKEFNSSPAAATPETESTSFVPTGIDPSIYVDTPQDRKKSLETYRARVADELARAKTPERRKILEARIKKIDTDLRNLVREQAVQNAPQFQGTGLQQAPASQNPTSEPAFTNPNGTPAPSSEFTSSTPGGQVLNNVNGGINPVPAYNLKGDNYRLVQSSVQIEPDAPLILEGDGGRKLLQTGNQQGLKPGEIRVRDVANDKGGNFIATKTEQGYLLREDSPNAKNNPPFPSYKISSSGKDAAPAPVRQSISQTANTSPDGFGSNADPAFGDNPELAGILAKQAAESDGGLIIDQGSETRPAVVAVKSDSKIKMAEASAANVQKTVTGEHNFQVYAPKGKKLSAAEAINVAFSKLPAEIQDTDKILRKLTGTGLWNDSDQYLQWAQNELDVSGNVVIKHQIDRQQQGFIDAFKLRGEEGLARELAASGGNAQDAGERLARENYELETAGDAYKFDDSKERRERIAKLQIERQLREAAATPSLLDEAGNVISDIAEGINPVTNWGNIYDATKNFLTGKESETDVTKEIIKQEEQEKAIQDKLKEIERTEGFEVYQQRQKDYAALTSSQLAGRLAGDSGRIILNTFIEIPKYLEIMDASLEDASPFRPLLGEYTPSIRSLGNALSVIVGKSLGKKPRFDSVNDPVSKRRIYQTAQYVTELIGQDDLLKDTMSGKVNSSVTSGLVFLAGGFAVRGAKLGVALLGASQQVPQMYQEMRQKGIDERTARGVAATVGNLLGASEIVGIGGEAQKFLRLGELGSQLEDWTFKTFFKSVWEFSKQAVREGKNETIEEGFQEWFQSTTGQATMNTLARKDKEGAAKIYAFFEEINKQAGKDLEDKLIAAGTGGLFGVGGSAARQIISRTENSPTETTETETLKPSEISSGTEPKVSENEKIKLDTLASIPKGEVKTIEKSPVTGVLEVGAQVVIDDEQKGTVTKIKGEKVFVDVGKDSPVMVKKPRVKVAEVANNEASKITENLPVSQVNESETANSTQIDTAPKNQSDDSPQPGFVGVSVKKDAPIKLQGIELKRRENSATVNAHDAATSPQNDLPEPTKAQIEAGNYKKGHFSINGLNISVENPVGSQRKGVDRDGKPWSVTMNSHYGYFKRTVGADEENIDVFVKDGTPADFAGNVFVVDQVHPDNGKFDEHKILLGFSSEQEAREAYAANYAKDWKGLQNITAMPFDQFKTWARDGEQSKPAATIKQASNKNLSNDPGEQIKNTFASDGTANAYSQDLRNKQWVKVQKGETTEAGGNSNLLIAAKNVRNRGGLQTQEEFSRFTDDFMNSVANKKGEELKTAGNDLIQRWTPKTETRVEEAKTENVADIFDQEFDKLFGVGEKNNSAPVLKPAQRNEEDFNYLDVKTDDIRGVQNIADALRETRAISHFETDSIVADYDDGKLTEKQALDEFQRVIKQNGFDGIYSSETGAVWDFSDKDVSGVGDFNTEKSSAKDSIKAAATDAKQGIDSALKGLAELFGDPNFKSTGMPAFDEKTYAKAKPHFEAAYESFKSSVKNVSEAVSKLIQTMNERGFSPETIKAMKPYFVRFIEDAEKNTLQSPENESITKKTEVKNDDAKPEQSDADGQGSDGGQRASDVRETDGSRDAGKSSERPGGISDGNLPADGRPGAGNSGALEPGTDGTGSATNDGEQTSGGNSDSASDGVPDRGNRSDDGKRDYLAPLGSLTREGSWRDTAKTNLDILELVKKLESENRLATPEEQQLLVKFTGWGASEIANNLFPGTNMSWNKSREILPQYARDGWKELAQRAKDLFTPEELTTALASTQNAHYTSEKIVRGIWDALAQFGFKNGSILEPGMGVGLFAAAAPKDVIENSRYTGIERDKLTAAIAKQLLQRQAVLSADFVKQKLPNDFFDVAIGNPPFASVKITDDPAYKKYRFMLHDYFFAKSIDKVRPGGLLVFVTSKGTMDKGDPKMRAYIAERADLLGAIRLPQTAFKQNAGTEVVTDVIFLRKRADGEDPAGEKWINRDEVEGKNKNGETVKDLINEYFVNHPEMVLGTHSFQGSMYKANEYTVQPLEGDIEEHFKKAVETLPTAVFAGIAKTDAVVAETAKRDFDPKAKKEGSLYIHDDGTLMKRESGSGVALSESNRISKNDEKWLKRYVGLRNALKQAQNHQLNDQEWETSLKELNRVYDDFVKNHGHILAFTSHERVKKSKTLKDAQIDEQGNRYDGDGELIDSAGNLINEEGEKLTENYLRFKNQRLLGMDVESSLIEALERITEDNQIVKAPMLLRRTINKPAQVEIKTLSDALAVSLDKLGTLNLGHVTELIQPIRKMSRDEVIKELGDAIFELPGGNWQLADEYLSGFVVDKLEEAEAAAAIESRFERNVEALLKVQPKPLETSQIVVGLGAAWIPSSVVNDFASEVLGFGKNATAFDALTNIWSVEGAEGAGSRSNRTASAEWGTADRSPQELLDAALNNKSIKIYDRVDKKQVLNEAQSAKANDIVKKMRDAFKGWVWTDAQRAEALSEQYNRKFNNIAPRSFDGSHLTLPGLSAIYKLHDHQKRAVWRILQTGNTYLAHAVGAGKTLEMIVSGMEQRRLGLIRKPMYVVPRHMLKQFSSEFLEAYPMANILVADEKNFAKENRRRFVAQAALNDLDAVIIPHTAFGLIRTREATSAVIVEDMVAQLNDAIAEVDDSERSGERTIKKLEARIETIRRRFSGKTDETRQDNVVDFEDLGVDFMYVDEAHEFRKLDFVTNRDAVKGVTPEGSRRALDLLIKLRYLETQRPGRSSVLASGTPITNTLAELYSLMRFMDPAELDAAGLSHFDAWAAQFGEVVGEYEMNAAGKYELVERFSRFINIPELMKRARKFMDVLTLGQLGSLVDLPTIKGGAPEVVIVPASEATANYLKTELDRRIKISREWKPSKDQPGNPDPLINIITDGRLSAIDMRFVDARAQNDPQSKLNVMIDRIIEKYNADKDLEYRHKNTGEIDSIKGSAQIVFSAVGFGEQVAISRGFDAKKWMLSRLTEAGIPASEIAFMSDYKTATSKEAMFQEMRQGTKKILVGSPKNMGTGVNVQKRLKTLHYLSPPWYPADVEQPDGRIIRQGNQNAEIEIFRYATKGTYDSTAWSMIARKSRAIEQAMTGDESQRTLEDITESSHYEMASALAAGDARAIQLAGLRREIERLERLRDGHHGEQRRLKDERRRADNAIERYTKDVERYAKAVESVGNYVSNEAFNASVSGQTFSKRVDVGNALKTEWEAAIKKNRSKVIATAEPMEIEVGKAMGKYPLIVRLSLSSGGIESMFYLQTEKVRSRITDDYVKDVSMVDSQGLGTRIYNALNNLSKEKREVETSLEEQKRTLKQIIAKTGRPFAEQQDLYEKIAEHAQLQKEMAEDATEKEAAPEVTASAVRSVEDIDTEIDQLLAQGDLATDPEIKKKYDELMAERFAASEPDTLKRAFDDYAAEDGKLTVAEIRELQYVPFDELLLGAEAVQSGDKIKANAKSHEIFRRAFEEARVQAGLAKRGSKDAEDLFAGVFLKPETVQKTIDTLRAKALEAKSLGYSQEEVATFENHAQMLEEAAKTGKGTAIVYVFDKALPEELFHQADFLGAMEKSLLTRHDENSAKNLDNHKITDILYRKHFSLFNEYKRLNAKMMKAVMRAEIPPYLLENSKADLAKLGITEDMIDDYLLTWFEGYALKNGVGALDNFEREELDVQEFIEKVKNAQQPEQVRANGQGNEASSDAGQNPSGETRAGPLDPGKSADGRKSPDSRTDAGQNQRVKLPDNLSEDSKEYLNLGENQKLASLPATLRRSGIDADDIAYEVFGDRAARESARRMLEEHGIDGSVKLLRGVQTPDVDHAILSFMLQRMLLDKAAEIEATNPTDAELFRNRALELGREHALKAVNAGRFTRAASIIQNSVEGVVYAAQGIVEEKYGEDKSLSPEELSRLESVARQAEAALTKVAALQKEKNNLKRKIKRLEEDKEGKKKTRRSGSLALRKKVVDLVKTKQSAKVAKIREQLLAKYAPATLKSIIGENGNLSVDMRHNLQIAKKMESEDIDEIEIHTEEEIYLATGWERGADGKWRYDLADDVKINHAALRSMLLKDSAEDLHNVLDSPRLFKIYPKLRNITVQFDKMSKNDKAYFDPKTGVIGLSNDLKWSRALGLTFKRGGGLTSDIIHEVQHAIQYIEGFTTGSNSQVAGWDNYWNKPGEVEARNAETRLELSREARKNTPISETEDVSRDEQLDWYFGSSEPATLKKVISLDGGFDEETLNDFAQVGAMYLLEGMARETNYLPDDFHADMLSEFGDVIGSEFQEIYMRAWEFRNEWLNEIRREQTEERIKKQFGEDLSDAEIDDILAERKEVSRRRYAIEQLHALASGAKRKATDAKRLNEIIVEIAENDDVAVGASIISSGGNPGEIYTELGNYGITDAKRQREIFRQGSRVYEKAKAQLRQEQNSVLEDISETQKLIRDLEDLQWKARTANRQAGQAVANELRRIKSGELSFRGGQIVDVVNASRTMMASFDLSGAMRQGGFFSIAKPEAQAKAFGNMLTSFSEKNYGRVMMDIENHARFTQAQRAGIDFAEAGKTDDSGGTMGEELYKGEQTIEKIPILGKVIGTIITKPSERTYTAFLDTQRMVIFDAFAQELEARGLSIKRNKPEFEKLAEFINVATGRGAMPNNRFAKLLLDLPLFAPRYTLSRLQLLNMTLNPVAYYNMPPATRKIVAKNAIRFYGTTAAVLTIAALCGVVSFDDDDDEFLKIKIGNTKYDIFAGTLQPAKMIIKLAHAAVRGNRIPGELPYDVLNTIGRFVRGKLSPLASLGIDALMGADYVGNEFSLTKGIVSRLIPLTFSDMYSAYQLDGAVGMAKTLPAIIGIGASTYKGREEKPRTEAEKLAGKAIAMKLQSKPQTTEEKEIQKLVSELTARSRRGENVASEVARLSSEGKISKDKAANILAAADKSYLVDKAENLPLDEFTAVYRVATSEEKKQLAPLLNNKMKNADIDGKLSPEQKTELQTLGGRVTGDFAMPEKVKTEFEKFGINTPDVGQSLSLEKGEKTKLSPEQYEKYRREALEKIYRAVQEKIDSPAYAEANAEHKEKMIRKAIAKARGKEQKETKKELKSESSGFVGVR